jgi:hypothetical protein
MRKINLFFNIVAALSLVIWLIGSAPVPASAMYDD